MGAWNLMAGLILIIVFLNNAQPLEAVPTGDSADGTQREIFPDFRQVGSLLTIEEQKARGVFENCTKKWEATINVTCKAMKIVKAQFQDFIRNYKGDIPGKTLKDIVKFRCYDNLTCSGGMCQCQATPFMETESCKFRKQDLTSDCESETEAGVKGLRRTIDIVPTPSGNTATDPSDNTVTTPNGKAGITPSGNTGTGVSDPSQTFQYIMLLAVIFFVAAN